LRFHRGIFTAVLLSLAVVCGCQDQSQSNSTSDGSPKDTVEHGFVAKTLRKGNGAEPATLDPHRAQGVTASNILRDMIEGLVAEAPDASLIPGAAERWEISPDGLVYTFYLREAGRWSNGDPVVAEDFVFSLRRSVDPATGSHYSQILAPIKNAEAVIAAEMAPEELAVVALDEKTVQITLKGTTPYFLGLLTHSSSHPVHPASVQKYGEDFTRPGNFIGNGAYQLTEWQVQDRIVLKPNEHYWDAANRKIDTVIYLPIEDAESEYKRYRANELDWTGSIPLPKCKQIKETLADELEVHPYLGTYYYGLNTRKAPLDDVRVRRALSLALDRQKLAEKVTKCDEIPAFAWVPPGVGNYDRQNPDYADWSQATREGEARRLLAEAGYGPENPAKIELLYNTSEGHKRIALAIGAMWQQSLGIKVDLVNQEWKVYLATRNQGNTQVFRAGWIGDYNDANTFLEIFHSKHGMNDVGYLNPEYDALLDAASVETDQSKRRGMLEQAERLLLADQALLPIYFYVSKSLVKPWVRHYQGNIMDHHYSKRMAVP